MRHFPKWICGLLATLALAACPGPESSTTGDDGAKFSVALASVIENTTQTILAPGSTVQDRNREVVGLAVNATAVKAGKAAKTDAPDGTELAVWLIAPTYFNNDGTVKKNDEGSYVVAWDAYVPGQSTDAAPSSVKKTGYGKDWVTINKDASNTEGRRKVQVGNELLAKKEGVLLVVSIYQPKTTKTELGDSAGRLKQYTLAITQAPDLAFTTATKVSAQGLAQPTPATQAEMRAAPEISGTVTPDAGDATGGTVTLALAAGATDTNNKVSLNNFRLAGAAPPDTRIVGLAGKKGITVAEGGDSVATSATVQWTAEARADFTSSTSNDTGEILLFIANIYGQDGLLEVLLDANHS